MSKTNQLPIGFNAAGVFCGLKKNGKNDLAFFYSEKPCDAVGVFTKNLVKAAPIIVSQKNIKNKISAIIANSGCANACTGQKGIRDAQKMCKLTAKNLGVKSKNILVASTGVIGQYLPMDKIEYGIKKLNHLIAQSLNHCHLSAVEGIMTTDTFPKIVHKKFHLPSLSSIPYPLSPVSIWGCCKGAGMIHPDLATMLCFIFTDAAISQKLLKEALSEAVEKSFNRISIDGDTSTNDCVFILANSEAKNKKIVKKDKGYFIFKNNLEKITIELAKMVVKDGEGATKLVKISVKNAFSENIARKIASTVATSPLVKTAIFGSDANWGRIIAAVGRSGVKIEPDKIDIFFDNLAVAKSGMAMNFSEKMAKKVLDKKEFTITVDLKSGKSDYYYYTSDLTTDYVKINASYRS